MARNQPCRQLQLSQSWALAQAGLCALFLLLALLQQATVAASLWQGYAAASALLASLLYSAAALARWRCRRLGAGLPAKSSWQLAMQRVLHSQRPPRPTENKTSTPGQHRLHVFRLRLRRLLARKLGWATIHLGLGSLLALWLALPHSTRPDYPDGNGNLTLASACGLALAFACLLLERRLAQQDRTSWPESRLLVLQLRALILANLLLALSGGLVLENIGSLRLPLLPACWLSLLSGEMLLRSLLAAFRPYHRGQTPTAAFDGLLASLLRHPGEQNLQQRLRQGLGIDLRQSWALGFLGRAFWPVCALMLGLGWLLSGVHAIATEQRGIYERFGQPAAVWQAGLHLGLPWPLGKVRLIENGVVHQLATGLVADDDGQLTPRDDITPADADDSPPASANRLWDGHHRAETVQLIASRQAQSLTQSTQLVGLDVRLVWRQGGSDQAAMAVYRLADAPDLLRSVANRTLLHYFASQQLDNLLGEGLSATARQLQARIQQQLDASASGLELLAVVIQAIHPPAAAANAYHGVQAAEILAQASVVQQKGDAVRSQSTARQLAMQTRSQASAAAAERLSTSKAAAIAFQADRQAYQAGGQAFLLERYLDNLGRGLTNKQAIIIDHRISNTGMPTIDLRTPATALDVTTALPPARGK